MKASFRLLCIFVTLLISQISRAYILANFDGQFDSSKPLRLLVVGYSHGVGAEFVETAVAVGRRYQQNFPEQQVLFLKNNETGTDEDLSELTRYGLKIIESNSETENAKAVVDLALRSDSLMSLEFFAHSAISLGAALENDKTRFNTMYPQVKKLRGHFEDLGYIFFHGCNGGYFEAPELSKLVKIPVVGALTSTDFRKLRRRGDFVFADFTQFPASSFARQNSESYSSKVSCSEGGCLRLQPDNFAYDGEWGQFSGGGLPFYKMFCNHGISEEECSKIMAYSLLGAVSVKPLTLASSEEDFIEVAKDFLCPSESPQGGLRSACLRELQNALDSDNEEYSPFAGNPLECDYKICNASWSCKYDPNGNPIHGTCKVVAPKNEHPKTMVQELKRYIQGFRALQPEEGSH